jgi:hypothetical protein
MPDSPLYNVGRPPRSSFLNPGDEPVEDNEMYKWARKENRLPTRPGSTIVKIADPAAPGGFRYVARQNQETGIEGGQKTGTMVGMPTDTGDQLGEVVVSSRDRVPSFLSRRAAAPLRQDYQQYKGDMAEEKERAKRIAEEGRAEERANRLADAAQAREMTSMRNRMTIEQEMRAADPNKPIQDKLLGGKLTELDDAAETRKSKKARKQSFLDGQDIPGISASGERATRDALNAGRDLSEAEQLGQRTHDEEYGEAKRLYASGDPEAVAQADQIVGEDKDLMRAKSFLPRDYEQKNALRQEQTLMDVGGPLASQLQPKRKLPSFIDAGINLALPGWSAGGGLLDLMADPEADNQSVRPAIEKAVLEVQSKNRVDKPAAIDALRKYLLRNRVPPQRVDALLPIPVG